MNGNIDDGVKELFNSTGLMRMIPSIATILESKYIYNLNHKTIAEIIKPILTSRNIFSKKIVETVNNTTIFRKITLPSLQVVPILIRPNICKKGFSFSNYPIVFDSTKSGKMYLMLDPHLNKNGIYRATSITGHALSRYLERAEDVDNNLTDRVLNVINELCTSQTLMDAESLDCFHYTHKGLFLGRINELPFTDGIKNIGVSLRHIKTFVSNDMLNESQIEMKKQFNPRLSTSKIYMEKS